MPELRIQVVSVPVSDQDRAKAFYLENLGFEEVSDAPYGEGRRWVEVRPTGSPTSPKLVPSVPSMPPGSPPTCPGRPPRGGGPRAGCGRAATSCATSGTSAAGSHTG